MGNGGIGLVDGRDVLEHRSIVVSGVRYRHHDSDWVPDRPGHDRRYAIDVTKLSTELGWEPKHTDFAAGLAETIEWCRASESWWRPAKEVTEARYRVQGR